MTAGNVLNFGADPLGNTDSYPAFQAAVDSPHAVEVPPGYYYLSQPVVFTKPKIVTMTRPLLEPFDSDPRRRPHRGPGPNVPESHTRLWTDQNINFFEIRSPQVFIEGGCFDAQRVIGWDKAALYYSGDAKDHNGRPNGWGGGARDFLVIGNFLDLCDLVENSPGNTGCGVFIDFVGYELDWAYWTHLYFSGRTYAVDCGWKSSVRSGEFHQWANTVTVNLEAHSCKQAIKNEAFNALTLDVKHQSNLIFSSLEEANSKASIESHSPNTLMHRTEFYDFGKGGVDVTGGGDIRYPAQKTLNITGENPVYARQLDSWDVNKSIFMAPERPWRTY